MLTIENLTKKFNSNYVLKNINLTIDTHEFYGLIGKNGTGKTTLINLIAGINQPDSGTIKFNSDVTPNEYKNKLGFMPDSECLYQELNGYKFLHYMGKLKNTNLTSLQIERLLKKVCLEVPTNLSIKNYSFGMKKKLALAQTLIGNPELLILDEPTSGVDPESAALLRQLFIELYNEGKTIIITSHNLTEIEKLCTKVSLLENGELISSDNISSLFVPDRTHFKKIIITFESTYSSSELISLLNNASIQAEIDRSSKTLLIDYPTVPINDILTKILQLENFKITEITTTQPDLEQLFF